MFKYHGCTGKRIVSEYSGISFWHITYEDGTHDLSPNLEIAVMLCDKMILRASI